MKASSGSKAITTQTQNRLDTYQELDYRVYIDKIHLRLKKSIDQINSKNSNKNIYIYRTRLHLVYIVPDWIWYLLYQIAYGMNIDKSCLIYE